MAVAAALPAYLDRRCRLLLPGDINPQIPIIQGVTVAKFSGGKSYGLKIASEVLQEITASSDAARRAEDAYKESYLKASRKKDGGGKLPRRGKGYNVQVLSANCTQAAMVMRSKDLAAHNSIGVMQTPEIDSLRNFGGNNSLKQLMEFWRLNWEGGMYVAERSGMESLSGGCELAISIYGCSTMMAFLSLFGGAVENGVISRITLCEIPDTPAGLPSPIFKSFDDVFRARIKGYTDKLRAAKPGDHTIPEITRWMQREEKLLTDYAVETGDDTLLRMSRRELVSAARIGFLLYLTEGKWTKAIDKYITHLYRHSLDLKMRIFDETLRAISATTELYAKRTHEGRPSLLPSLPDQFSLEELTVARAKAGMSDKKEVALYQVKNWQTQRKVIRIGKEKWQKTSATAPSASDEKKEE